MTQGTLDVVVVVGAGSIGQAIARRVGAGKHVLLTDLRLGSADAAAKVLDDAGFVTSTIAVDISSRSSVEALVAAANAIGDVTGPSGSSLGNGLQTSMIGARDLSFARDERVAGSGSAPRGLGFGEWVVP